MFDIAFTGIKPAGFEGVDVEAEDAETGIGVAQHQRQSDIAQTDDADDGGPVCKFSDKLVFHIVLTAFQTAVPSEECYFISVLYSEIVMNPSKNVIVFPEHGFDVVFEDFAGNGRP